MNTKRFLSSLFYRCGGKSLLRSFSTWRFPRRYCRRC